MERAVISLGSNLLDREKYLSDARILLEKQVGKLVCASRIYETPSWGFASGNFLNQVVVMDTLLEPSDLLLATQQIERQLGRTQKTQHDAAGKPIYHDRTIDIDILLYGSLCFESPELTLPHPRIAERAFVLEPLAELFENQIVSPFTASFKAMLEKLKEQ